MDKNHILNVINEIALNFKNGDHLNQALASSDIYAKTAIRLLQVELDNALHLGHMTRGASFDYIANAVIDDYEDREAAKNSDNATPSFCYTGIGARKAPDNVNRFSSKLASRLEVLGFKMRTGRAYGQDWAFEEGVRFPENKEIYLPKKGYHGSTSTHYDVSDTAISLALLLHPSPDSLRNSSGDSLLLMARNGYEVLGQDLDLTNPSDFVACYTEDGVETAAQRTIKTGGTGQAIMLADLFDIPVYNFKNQDALLRLTDHIESLKQLRPSNPPAHRHLTP